MRIVVLGATGMLGQAVSKEARSAELEIVEVSRSSGLKWDYFADDFGSLAREVALDGADVLVNCIGWIPQKSSGSRVLDEQDANALNVELIREIQASQDDLGFGWVQIVTDCVFSGKVGNYDENSIFDPFDLYGITKAKGESLMPGAMRIRSSIIGPDSIHNSGLYEWFRKQSPNSQLKGFTNHFWNGVSTKAFGRLVAGLSKDAGVRPGIQHWIPQDSMSKYTLLQTFKVALGREDISIDKFETAKSLNRVLATSNHQANSELWAIAGYNRIPSIEELALEFIHEELKEGH